MNMHDEIAAVAYELYEARRFERGHALDDWLAGEMIVLSRHAGQDLEEPEEEEEEGAVAGAAPGVRTAMSAPAGPAEETEEAYYSNEEMS
jgi:hypothetical protein